MPLALQNSVDIELLIEGSRDELFKRITFQDLFLWPFVLASRLYDNQASHFLYPAFFPVG